jgi:hypothetical protein
MMRDFIHSLIDVHHRPNEVHTDLLGGSGAEDVSPELLALLLRPGVGALIDRDDELRNVSKDLEELGFCGFHSGLAEPKTTR